MDYSKSQCRHSWLNPEFTPHLVSWVSNKTTGGQIIMKMDAYSYQTPFSVYLFADPLTFNHQFQLTLLQNT